MDLVKKRIEGARVINVVEVRYIKGDGTKEDPVRTMIQYWDMDGKFLAEQSKPCCQIN